VVHAIDDSVSVCVRHIRDVGTLATAATAHLDERALEQPGLIRVVVLGRVVVATVAIAIGVAFVGDAVAVEVATVRARTRAIAGIAEAVVIRVRLTGIEDARAVVVAVANAVLIAVAAEVRAHARQVGGIARLDIAAAGCDPVQLVGAERLAPIARHDVRPLAVGTVVGHHVAYGDLARRLRIEGREHAARVRLHAGRAPRAVRAAVAEAGRARDELEVIADRRVPIVVVPKIPVDVLVRAGAVTGPLSGIAVVVARARGPVGVVDAFGLARFEAAAVSRGVGDPGQVVRHAGAAFFTIRVVLTGGLLDRAALRNA
jgi:hypothetical protein